MNQIQFTSAEIQDILQRANFSEDELQLFMLRNRELSIEECADPMHMCVRNVYRVSKKMKTKILKVI